MSTESTQLLSPSATQASSQDCPSILGDGISKIKAAVCSAFEGIKTFAQSIGSAKLSAPINSAESKKNSKSNSGPASSAKPRQVTNMSFMHQMFGHERWEESLKKQTAPSE